MKMGNIGSQSGQISSKNVAEEQWAHSYPRTQPPRLQQHKVLPERDTRQKLRPTNNGEILQSGGTISGRPAFNRSLSVGEQKLNNDDIYEEETSHNPPRMYVPNQRDPLHKSGYRYTQGMQNKRQNEADLHEKMKRFGSEPDLRYSAQVIPADQEMRERNKINRKKYRAPPPPHLRKSERNLSTLSDWDENEPQKTRLYKTRAETKHNYSSPVNKQYNERVNLQEKNINEKNNENKPKLRSNRLSLPELKMAATIDFQEELKEATKRLRYTKPEEPIKTIKYEPILEKKVDEKSKLKTLDPNIHTKDFRKKLKQMNEENLNSIRGEPSGKECSSEEKSPIAKPKKEPKTFYFGMDDPPDNYENDVIDHFTSNLRINNKKLPQSSESDISSEIEMDDCQISKAGIDLQLRPMLPKKQLEIPRFSPAAAWKLLSTIDNSDPATSTIASDDSPVFIEDRIEKYSRPPPPTINIGPRSSNDKSGDSGISGDAGPAGYDDTQENLMNARNNIQIVPGFPRAPGVSWTPQQDLEDDSSLEEGLNNSVENNLDRNYSKRPHVFSLSLPRDNHLASYLVEKNIHHFSGLQKLKRSVSGVLNTISNNKKGLTQPNLTQEQSDNWFLSKSAPNSLNNGPNSLEIKVTPKSEESSQPLPNSGRVMYLPEFQNQERQRSRSKEESRERSKSADRLRDNKNLSLYSKSCENISVEIKDFVPQSLQDPPKEYHWKNNARKPKKFTFQSTVRQIERKRLAEKLSREAERKESQRLRELEAMQKVEEEFQKKRAREKATIRQQLRLYTMDESWSSLPPNLEIQNSVPIRQEPDGAVSSPTASPPLKTKTPELLKKGYQKYKKSEKHRPSSESSEDNKIKAPVTQILSEFRQPQRDYKEFRGSGRYLNELTDPANKQTTVHPQVTCNMPKAKGQNSNKTSGNNYRKDFAHGVKSNRSAGSTYSEDSQSRNNSPRLYHNKYTPITSSLPELLEHPKEPDPESSNLEIALFECSLRHI